MNDLKIEDIQIGADLLNTELNTISTIIGKTTNSVELFNRTDRKNCYTTGQLDADGIPQKSGRRKGIDGKNWYTIQDFNKKFKII